MKAMIRPLKQEDFSQVLEMMKVFYASDALIIHASEEVLRRTLNECLSDSRWADGFVFEEDGELAGYGIITRCYSTETGGVCVWIEDLYLRPQFRGKGLGSGFLAYVEEISKGSAVRLRLEAEKGNDNALEVYRRAGFEVLDYVQLVKEI